MSLGWFKGGILDAVYKNWADLYLNGTRILYDSLQQIFKVELDLLCW